MAQKRTRKTHQKIRKTEKKYRGGKRQMKKLVGNNEGKSKLISMFIEMLNTVKLYHWKTQSYPQHKATDELYSKLNEHIDTFVEVLLGKDESRIKMIESRIKLYDFSSTNGFKEKIYEYRDFLISLTYVLDDKENSDLLNIRDEILADINQFLYLLSFDKLK